ncbi:MAG: hypothetical protein K6E51_11530 [Treponema sp.]|nr:hypothetical protein [Treponema sp.]
MAITNKRGVIVRSVLIVVYVLLAIVMFTTGRSHTVLIDNKKAEDGSYNAINGMTVKLNNQKPSEFMKGDRDKFTVKGQTLKIHVESFDGMIEKTWTVKIPMKQDAVLISIPKLANDIDGAMEPFDLN